MRLWTARTALDYLGWQHQSQLAPSSTPKYLWRLGGLIASRARLRSPTMIHGEIAKGANVWPKLFLPLPHAAYAPNYCGLSLLYIINILFIDIWRQKVYLPWYISSCMLRLIPQKNVSNTRGLTCRVSLCVSAALHVALLIFCPQPSHYDLTYLVMNEIVRCIFISQILCWPFLRNGLNYRRLISTCINCKHQVNSYYHERLSSLSLVFNRTNVQRSTAFYANVVPWTSLNARTY